jgi:hypothetical protein
MNIYHVYIMRDDQEKWIALAFTAPSKPNFSGKRSRIYAGLRRGAATLFIRRGTRGRCIDEWMADHGKRAA